MVIIDHSLIPDRCAAIFGFKKWFDDFSCSIDHLEHVIVGPVAEQLNLEKNIREVCIVSKSMQNNISIRRAKTSGNPVVSQSNLAISI